MLVVLMTGMFQEEALYAPPALGLLLFLTGLVIGSRIRVETAEATTRYRPDKITKARHFGMLARKARISQALSNV